jgi:hypothetical protein
VSNTNNTNNTGDILAKAVESIAELAKRANAGLQVIKHNPEHDYATLYNTVTHETIEVAPPPKRHAPVLLGVADLLAWAKTQVDETNARSSLAGDIVISGSAGTSAHWPRVDRTISFATATKPFFKRFLPEPIMKIGQWARWFDSISAGAPAEYVSAVNAALSRVTAGASKEVTIERNDAVAIQLSTTVNGVKTAAPFPKRLVANIPYGDPEFRADVCFVFSLEAARDEVVVTSSVDELYGGKDIRQEYVNWAKAQLQPLEEAGWAIMGAP